VDNLNFHYYYSYLLTSSVKQRIVVDKLVAKLTNTCRHEGGKVHCNIAHRCQVSATKIAEECNADHSKQLPGHTRS